MTRPTTSIDVFSPAAYLDDQAVADKFAALRAEGDIFWVDQSPYRPFWAVLRQEDIMSVERNTKIWLNAPRLVIMPSAAMYDKRESCCVTPARSMRKRLSDQLPVLSACSMPFVIVSCRKCFMMSKGSALAGSSGALWRGGGEGGGDYCNAPEPSPPEPTK